MPITAVETLSQALEVRHLRNSCRDQLTNHHEYIGVLRQVRWYFQYYRRARAGEYRLYLLSDDAGVALGFGAARLHDNRLLITECVGPKHRRQGYGTRILQHLITIGAAERRELVAEIWGDNTPSRSLHEHAGFELASVANKNGRELATYVWLPG